MPPDSPKAPGLNTLASSYDVLKGKYADASSVKQTILDWEKCGWTTENFGGKTFSVPKSVNFIRNITNDFSSSSGKSTSDYVKSLAVHAGLEGEYSFFSGSVSVDYSKEEQNSLSNVYTRITYLVTHYNLVLPSLLETRGLLRDGFKTILETANPDELYKEYGTHLVRSITIGGRGVFTSVTDTRKYVSKVSVEAAAKLAAKWAIASMKADMSVKDRETAESFNSASHTKVHTEGGDGQYGNDNFPANEEKWAASIIEWPGFIDFGNPAFIPLWELAASPARKQLLKDALKVYLESYKPDLGVKGPYLETRKLTLTNRHQLNYFLPDVYDPWYHTGMFFTLEDSVEATIVKELVPGTLAPVTWEIIYTGEPELAGMPKAHFWKAKPQNDDYIALSHVFYASTNMPDDPPADITKGFRAVHKSAVEPATLSKSQKIFIGSYSAGAQSVWFVDNGILFSSTTQKPLDKPYKLKVSETRPYGDS